MSKPSARIRIWTRPRLLAADAEEPTGSADALWAQGEAAEASYDFETAQHCYRAAARAATPARIAEYLQRYTEFLVERFGQFEEVAAWLDDPAFAAADAVPDDANGLTMLRLVARAARETGHPRATQLDDALAARGDPTGVERTAMRLVAEQRSGDARKLLERHASVLTPLGPADKLLGQMRAEEQARCATALAPAEAALQRHELAQARALLEPLRDTWRQAAPFLSLEAHLRAAETLAEASRLREAIDLALDREDLEAALDAARALAAAPGSTETDRNYLTFINRRQRDAQVQAALAAAAVAPDDQTLLQTLAGAVDRFGAEAILPPPGQALAWSVVREVADLQTGPIASHAPELSKLLALRTALESNEAGDLEARLLALPPAWQKGPTGQRARAVLQAAHEARQKASELQTIERLSAALETGDLDAAAAVLHAWTRQHPVLSAELKHLRSELTAARQNDEKRLRLRGEFADRLAKDNFFAAQATLADLAHLVPAAERIALQAQLDERAAPALRARGMPPGVQKLDPAAPIATGIAHGRLVVVQSHMWLTLNLETGGLQPFALPEAWPVQAQAWTRIAAVGPCIRLVGLSGQRLVVIEQVPGQAPVIVAAAELRSLLRGDDLLIGAALQPEAGSWRLLSRSSQRGNATTWHRVTPMRLEPLDYHRTTPPLASLTGIDGGDDQAVVVAQQRSRDAFAVALMDAEGEPIARLSTEEVAEPIAGIRHAIAWPAQDRIYASFDTYDPFGLDTQLRSGPSLLVLRGGNVSFASSELRRRLAPADRITIDHAWTLDPAQGRLWFAALPMDGDAPDAPESAKDALLLGVDARTLRPDKPAAVQGVARVLALLTTTDGVVALSRMHGGGYGLTRARVGDAGLALTTTRLPL